jgi:hypothetical protein
MRQEIRDLLGSKNENQRIMGWTKLRDDCVKEQYVIGRNDFLFLAGILLEEVSDDVYRFGIITLVQIVALRRRDDLADTPLVECLRDFIWNSFHAKSAVLATAGDQHLRDGMALLQLARLFGWVVFPNTNIELVPLSQPDWQVAFCLQKLDAICLVGRIGLFGDEANRYLSCPNARLRFNTNVRPPSLAPQALDDEYHCIVEQPKGGDTEYHRSIDNEDGRRTDYALVQRYMVQHEGRQIVVVYIAGNTSLGTLGAAIWAALHLQRLCGPNGAPIPCPPTVSMNTTVEALLEVREDIDKEVWHPEIRLLRLATPDAVWSETTGKWHSDITVKFENGDLRKPIGVLFGSAQESMKTSKTMFRLLVAVCLLSQTNPEGRIHVADLAEDKWIWDGKTISGKAVRKKLAQLKCAHKKLRDLLTLEPSVHLYAHVTIENVPCVAAGVQSPKRKRRGKGDNPAGSEPPKPR